MSGCKELDRYRTSVTFSPEWLSGNGRSNQIYSTSKDCNRTEPDFDQDLEVETVRRGTMEPASDSCRYEVILAEVRDALKPVLAFFLPLIQLCGGSGCAESSWQHVSLPRTQASGGRRGHYRVTYRSGIPPGGLLFTFRKRQHEPTHATGGWHVTGRGEVRNAGGRPHSTFREGARVVGARHGRDHAGGIREVARRPLADELD